MENPPPLAKEQSELMEAIGVTLLVVQQSERLINMSLTYVLQLDGSLTIDTLTRIEGRKRTLGQLLVKMRSHIDLEPRFDAILSEFLDKRNTFIHELPNIPGWSTESREGILTARAFVHRLYSLSGVVTRIFGGLLRAWAKLNPQLPPFPEMDRTDEVSQVVQWIFFKKPDLPQSN